MNETILTPRQAHIYQIIIESEGISRKAIEERIASRYPTSKVTLTRDLALLIEYKYIRIQGAARSTIYFPYETNPVLRPFNLSSYFAVDTDRRHGQSQINLDLFSKCTSLFSENEIQDLKRIHKSFENESAKLDPSLREKELERFIIELSWKSSKIEGNTYTLLDTEQLIKNGVEAPGHSKFESTMILNHKHVFSHILAHKKEYREITLQNMNELHQKLVAGLGVGTGLRNQAVGITGTTYVPPGTEWQIREALEISIPVINSSSFPLEKALLVSAFISYIQPYVDGNKRTGRMLANAVLIAHDFFPLSYRAVDEGEYKSALILFYEQNSLFLLKKIFTEQYRFAINTYFK